MTRATGEAREEAYQRAVRWTVLHGSKRSRDTLRDQLARRFTVRFSQAVYWTERMAREGLPIPAKPPRRLKVRSL